MAYVELTVEGMEWRKLSTQAASTRGETAVPLYAAAKRAAAASSTEAPTVEADEGGGGAVPRSSSSTNTSSSSARVNASAVATRCLARSSWGLSADSGEQRIGEQRLEEGQRESTRGGGR